MRDQQSHVERWQRFDRLVDAFTRALDEYHRTLPTVPDDHRFMLLWSKINAQGLAMTLALEHDGIAFRFSDCPKIGGE